MVRESIFKTVIYKFWWLFPVLILLSIFKTRWFKGLVGEMLVRLSANFFLDKKIYRAIHNVTLNTPDGTTQIDHVFVSRYGIFVVETKNYSGWIFGNENQAMWTQKLFKVSNKFQNPLRQNFKHIKAVESLLGIPLEYIHSVVVFVGGSTFKTEMPPNVTYAGGYISYIKSVLEPVFTDVEVEGLFNTICSGRRLPSLATNREHVKNVQARVSSDAKRLCPKCGSEMVQRKIKSGKKAGNLFWGCSGFPKCKTVLNVT